MSGWHGVTSVVIGNCGFGFAPCKPEDRDRAMLTVSRNEAVPLRTMQAGMPWDWVTFPEFLDSVDRTPKGVNVMAFVPLAPLYVYVAGVDKAKAYRVTDEELDEMCRLLVEAMEVGGCGWSAQIAGEVGNVQLDFDGTPMVTDCMTEHEVAAFSRALGSVGRGVVQLTGSLDIAALIARESGRPVIWNALLADGALNQHGAASTRTVTRSSSSPTSTRRRGCASSRRRSRRTSSPSSPSRTTTSSTRSRAGRKHCSARSRRSGRSSPTPSAAPR